MASMKRLEFMALMLPVLAVAKQDPYEKTTVEGWTVIVSRMLREKDRATAEAALELLQIKLQDVVRQVPAEPLKHLRAVPIWMEDPSCGVDKCASYHPSAQWLKDHGHSPAKAGCVEIANPSLFIKWSKAQPSMVLHELAHAYHHQVLTHAYRPIREAYNHALKTGLYAEVKHVDGSTQRAYALTNFKEYFSELTEAYFGKNDFHPFVRAELRTYDPQGYAVVEAAWKVAACAST